MNPRTLITGGTGYIGSRLRAFLPDADSVDLEWFGNPGAVPNTKRSYQSLYGLDLACYDTIVHLAAHSSVAMCQADPQEAVCNNLMAFEQLLRLCWDKRLIYASSGSVYHGSGAQPATEAWERFQPSNSYDVSKYQMDLMAQAGGGDVYGLRFGTVCGWSPNLRTDLMLNRMVRDAQETGVVTMTNPTAHRAILAIDDLCQAIQACTRGDERPGLYNLGSVNVTVRETAEIVARRFGAHIQEKPGGPTYDFCMDCRKFSQAYGFAFTGTVESIVDGLVAQPALGIGGRP